jgi:hypothetical protein
MGLKQAGSIAGFGIKRESFFAVLAFIPFAAFGFIQPGQQRPLCSYSVGIAGIVVYAEESTEVHDHIPICR